jgi:hypothetical protein
VTHRTEAISSERKDKEEAASSEDNGEGTEGSELTSGNLVCSRRTRPCGGFVSEPCSPARVNCARLAARPCGLCAVPMAIPIATGGSGGNKPRPALQARQADRGSVLHLGA